MALSTGLVSYWKMDESSTGVGAVTRNDSHGANHLTDNNTTASASGKLNNAADLERTNSEYFSLTLGSTGLELTTSFTVSFWIFIESLPGFMTIYKAGTNTNHWRIGVSSTDFKLIFTEDNIADNKGATTLSTSTWYHCVVTKDGDGASNLNIYLNNSLNNTFSVGSVATPSGTLEIGRYGAASGHFDGLLDEVGVWSRALNTTEIAELYGSGTPPSYPFTTTNTGSFFAFF